MIRLISEMVSAPQVWVGTQNANAGQWCTLPKRQFLASPYNRRTPSPTNVQTSISYEPAINVPKTGPEPSEQLTSKEIKIGISGGGPRAMNHIISLVALLCIHEKKLTQLLQDGIDFSIQVTVFEKQPKKRGAGGNAFQPECDATLNTGLPGRMKIPGLDKISKTHPTVDAATDLAKTVAHMVESDPEKFMQRYKKSNLAAYSMFKKALRPDGTLDTSVPCLTRDVLGAGLTKNVNDVIAYANDVLPFIDIEVCYNQQVTDVDFSDPEAPALVVIGEDGLPKRHTFDMVFLANGTPMKSRVPKSIAHMVYSQIPNRHSMSAFLRSLGLYHNHNSLKQGTKLGVIGASLSSYDYVNLLATQLGIVVPSTSGVGYRIDPTAAAKYQGLITLINPTAGRATPPAISNAPAGVGASVRLSWPAGLPNGIGSCDEIHSTFLHKHFDAFPLFRALTKANIARALGIIPRNVNESKSTKERLSDYQCQINDFLTGKTVTEWGFWKNAYLQVISGVGFHPNSEEADKLLSTMAPLTHSPFNMLRKYRAYISAFTDPKNVKNTSNAKAVNVLNEVERLLGPSPIASQQMVNLLSEAGVLNQVCGTSDQLRMSDDEQFVELDDLQFHAILAPKVMTREADIVLRSIMHFVQQAAPGQPEYTKGRFLVGQDGKPLNVYECGMVGEGARVQNADGTFSLVGMRWPDTHGYSNLMELVCQAPYLTLSFAILKSAGVKDPIAHIQEQYRKNLPDPQIFDAETAKFEGAFQEILQKIAFLNLCEVLAGDDGTLYREFTDNVFTYQDRAAFVEGLKMKQLSEAERMAFDAYKDQTTNPLKYQPASMEEFTDRFVDFTQEELDRMLKKAIAQAQARAESDARGLI